MTWVTGTFLCSPHVEEGPFLILIVPGLATPQVSPAWIMMACMLIQGVKLESDGVSSATVGWTLQVTDSIEELNPIN